MTECTVTDTQVSFPVIETLFIFHCGLNDGLWWRSGVQGSSCCLHASWDSHTWSGGVGGLMGILTAPFWGGLLCTVSICLCQYHGIRESDFLIFFVTFSSYRTLPRAISLCFMRMAAAWAKYLSHFNCSLQNEFKCIFHHRLRFDRKMAVHGVCQK